MFYLTICLNMLVDVLLLMGANRLSGFPHAPLRCLLAAGISGIYAGFCLKFSSLGMFFWHFLALVVVSVVAFGISVTMLRRGILFLLLRLAVGGIASGFSGDRHMGLLAAAALVGVMCLLGFGGRAYGREYIPVELCHNGKKLRLLALRDTGNTLRDPITGQAVLVVDSLTGQKLLGLTPQQLADPVETVASAYVPGLRLLPYRSIGMPQGMLAAIQLPDTRIGDFRGSTVVAFAPQMLDREGIYRGLTGGIV